MCTVNPFPDHLAFISCSANSSQVAMMRSVEDTLAKQIMAYRMILCFVTQLLHKGGNSSVVVSHVYWLTHLIRIFPTDNWLVNKSQTVFLFNTRYFFLSSVRDLRSSAISQESRKTLHLFVLSRWCYAHQDFCLRHTIQIQRKFIVTNVYEWKTEFRMLWS